MYMFFPVLVLVDAVVFLGFAVRLLSRHVVRWCSSTHLLQHVVSSGVGMEVGRNERNVGPKPGISTGTDTDLDSGKTEYSVY